MKESIVDLVATKGPKLWKLNIFKQGKQALFFSLIFFNRLASEASVLAEGGIHPVMGWSRRGRKYKEREASRD